MEMSISQSDSHARFIISGDIDESGAEKLKSGFKSLKSSKVRKITIDFGNVTYIGSAGIGKLLVLYKDMAVSGAVIRVENVASEIYKLFQLCRLNDLFTVVPKFAA